MAREQVSVWAVLLFAPEARMKKVVLAIAVLVTALSWNQLAAGQTGANTPVQTAAVSLDDQMFVAIEKGDFATVLQLLEKGAHINAQGENGITALIAASAMGKTDVVKQLLDKGASTDLKDSRGDTALNYAVMVSNIDEVKLLLAK